MTLQNFEYLKKKNSGTSQQTWLFWNWFILHVSSQHIRAFHLMMLCTCW